MNKWRRLFDQLAKQPRLSEPFKPREFTAPGGGGVRNFFEALAYAESARREDRAVMARGVRIEYTTDRLVPPGGVNPKLN